MANINNVFINCPFDADYFPLLMPLLFTTIYCGLEPQISETIDSHDYRIENIKSLIFDYKYSIHETYTSQLISAHMNPDNIWEIPFSELIRMMKDGIGG